MFYGCPNPLVTMAHLSTANTPSCDSILSLLQLYEKMTYKTLAYTTYYKRKCTVVMCVRDKMWSSSCGPNKVLIWVITCKSFGVAHGPRRKMTYYPFQVIFCTMSSLQIARESRISCKIISLLRKTRSNHILTLILYTARKTNEVGKSKCSCIAVKVLAG